MLATVERSEALRLLKIEHDELRALIDELTDEEITRPDTIEFGLYADQELSFKDLLAHLVTYEAYAVEAIEAWKASEKHHITDAMRSPRGSIHVHYGGIADRRHLSLVEMIASWEETQSALMDAISQLSDNEWYSRAPYNDKNDFTNLGGMLEEILVAPPRPMYRHLPVHIPDTNAYIQKLRRGERPLI